MTWNGVFLRVWSYKIGRANHNYPMVLIIWDVIFRSRYLPKDRRIERTGVTPEGNFPQGYLEQIKVPFNWEKWQAAPATPSKHEKRADESKEAA